MKATRMPAVGGGGEHDLVEGVVVGVRIAMVDVVELAHGGDAGRPHLAEGLEGERPQLVRVQPSDQGVHRLAPGPEVAGPRGEGLAAPPQAALEGVRVGAHHAGQEGAAGQSPVGRAARAPTSAMRPSSPMAIWTPDSKRPPVQVRSASRIFSHAPLLGKNAGPFAPAGRGRRRIRPSAGTRSACGPPRSSRGRRWRSPSPAAAASRRRWRRRRSLPRSGRRDRRDGGGWGGLVEQHRRAVREQLDRRLEGGRGGAGGAAHPLDQLLRGDARQRPEPTSTTQRSGTTLIAEPPWTVPTLSGT